MICKDSVLKWFKELSSHNRIDLMCSLLNKCLPFELRFIGTCLEDLGRQDFNQMKDFEIKANNVTELSEFQVQCIISDTRTRQKLALYVCLLHSLNAACSTLIYKSLYGIDINEVVSAAKNSDEKILEELLTIYTVAVNHPAFSFEQRSNLGSILLRLSQEENRLKAEKLAEAVNADYAQTQVASSDNLDTSTTEIAQQNAPPGLGFPPGFPSTGNLIPFPMYSTFPAHQLQHQPIVWQLFNYQPVSAENVPPNELPPPFPASPLISRHSSPSQSAQHSRAGSPARKTYFNRSERNDVPKTRPSFSESTFSNPPPMPKPSFVGRGEVAAVDSSGSHDKEVRGLNERMTELSTEEMLRGAVVSLNGITGTNRVPVTPHQPVRQSLPGAPSADPDMPSQGLAPSTRSVEHGAAITLGCQTACRTPQLRSTSRLSQSTGCKNNSHGMKDSRNCSSSSGSDASSTSHSPPVTPASLTSNWEKGFEPEEPKTRGGMGRGRGRFAPQVQTLPRERVPLGVSVRRDGPRSAPPTPHEEKKPYLMPPPGGDMVPPSLTAKVAQAHDLVATGMPYAAPFFPFTSAPPMFPPYPPTFVRPPYSYPNGDALYTYQPQPPTPFLPSPLVTYSSSVPPPKIACYNCSSQTHHPNDCKEPTMEEYSSKGQYRIDYGKSNELLSSDK